MVENLQIFEITRTIFSSSERSEQLLVMECFLTCSWGFLIPNKLEQLQFKLEKNFGIQKSAGKVRKRFLRGSASCPPMIRSLAKPTLVKRGQKRPNEAMLWTKIITNFDPLKKVLQNRTDITY